MALVVGINIALALRLTGLVPAFELTPFLRFYRWHWAGALLILLSGLALLLAYPAKALTNPVFFLKLAALSVALLISRAVQTRIEAGLAPTPVLHSPTLTGATLLALWATVIVAGRFLAYTHTILLAARFY